MRLLNSKVVFFVAVCLSIGVGASVVAATDQIVTIGFNSTAQLQELTERVDVWTVDRTAGSLTAWVDEAELGELEKSGDPVSVDEVRANALTRTSRADGRVHCFERPASR